MDLFEGPELGSIGELLGRTRDAFTAALAGRGGGPHGNALTFAGTELLVDQVRGLAAMAGNDDAWTVRDGHRLIRNDTLMARSYLGYIVGSQRYLSSQDVLMILAHRDSPLPIRESDLAMFVNLFVAEPLARPDHELLVWHTLASQIAAGDLRGYLYTRIPGLRSDHDILHAEIPAGAPLADPLRPRDASSPALLEGDRNFIRHHVEAGIAAERARFAAFTPR